MDLQDLPDEVREVDACGCGYSPRRQPHAHDQSREQRARKNSLSGSFYVMCQTESRTRKLIPSSRQKALT